METIEKTKKELKAAAENEICDECYYTLQTHHSLCPNNIINLDGYMYRFNQ